MEKMIFDKEKMRRNTQEDLSGSYFRLLTIPIHLNLSISGRQTKEAVSILLVPSIHFHTLENSIFRIMKPPVSSIALNEWAHLKTVIHNDHADFYVNDEHVLHVGPLLHSSHNRKSVCLLMEERMVIPKIFSSKKFKKCEKVQ